MKIGTATLHLLQLWSVPTRSEESLKWGTDLFLAWEKSSYMVFTPMFVELLGKVNQLHPEAREDYYES